MSSPAVSNVLCTYALADCHQTDVIGLHGNGPVCKQRQ